MQKKFRCLPLDKIFITQLFGANPDFYRKYGLKGHNGIDFRTKFKDTPQGKREIYAVDDGTVLRVVIAKNGGYGTYVSIKHDDGSITLYGHQYVPKVKTGQRVQAGDVIGISDNTGDSTGPHLHLSYKPKDFNKNNGYNGYIDPYPFMPLPPLDHFVGCEC